jgi:hypothetical protein
MLSRRAAILALLAFAGSVGGYVLAHWTSFVR